MSGYMSGSNPMKHATFIIIAVTLLVAIKHNRQQSKCLLSNGAC